MKKIRAMYLFDPPLVINNITLPPGGEMQVFNEDILDWPEVKAAIADGKIEVIDDNA